MERDGGGCGCAEGRGSGDARRLRARATVSRRAFLAAGTAAGLSWLVGTKAAWGGVGGGGWGAIGSVAAPGNHFGYDGGWGYSDDGKVWLSVSCNATVGRMTELFLEISVTSYYANGGVWNPTWFTDYPDTHVDSFIRDESGWLASKSGFYDTTYDNSNYHGPYVTDTLRVARASGDWQAWAGVRAWCDSPDSAYGIDTTAEASQIIPAHVLNDDASWRGRIITVRPRSAEHLLMDASGGGVEAGSNVVGWRDTHTTNQNWIVAESPQGRTSLVPVHAGASALYLDVQGGDWFDGDNVHLWTPNGGAAQSLYLHDFGDGYHMLVFECSGCALDLEGDAQADGANFRQWNPYGDWTVHSRHMRIEEVVFGPRFEGAFAIEGDLEAGGELSPTDPDATCYPYNYPGTSGMTYRYAWYRGGPGSRGELVQGPGDEAAYRVTEADEGSRLTCVVTAYARFRETPYRGEAAAFADVVRKGVAVRFFVDGEARPCYEVEAGRDEAFSVPREAWAAAEKEGCAGVEGWFADVGCSVRFEDGAIVSEPLDLHAYNRVTLAYAQADASCLLRDDRAYFLDEGLSIPLREEDVLPGGCTLRFGERVSFERGAPAWFEERGRVRTALCDPGAYATAAAEGVAQRMARLVRNTEAYLLWRTPAYDGIELS
ncbi:RICIN domain-containing protein [Gordonibacter sp. An230]|uniref:RICIN domain-containing protein n=1 Tax=Gordonibacter sp. An230 TaxID=1965592 RepID=UPI0013A65CF8|nr:RICIN domain-containing protein [Gordonibacter sp. An230]